MANQKFKLPKAFINQLGEFTTGYLLITVNGDGEFETFFEADSPVVRLGIVRYLPPLMEQLDSIIDTGATGGTGADVTEEEGEGNAEEA